MRSDAMRNFERNQEQQQYSKRRRGKYRRNDGSGMDRVQCKIAFVMCFVCNRLGLLS